MKARTDTKEKIIELGRDLIQTVGYPSLSYQQISSKLGIKNAAVHYHYPAKEDLGLDIVRNDAVLFEKFANEIANKNPWEQLDAFLHNYRKSMEDGNKICLIGANASDHTGLPENIQKASTEYFLTVKNWFTTLLDNGRAQGSFHFKGASKNKAALIASALAGALQHARLAGNDHYDDVVNQIKIELKE